METIGFIGAGAMGLPMLKHLIDAGHTAVCFDLNPADLGDKVTWVDSPKAVAEAAETIFMCLPSEKVVEVVLHGDDGLLAGRASGLTVVDMTTNQYEAAAKFGAELDASGSAYLDAPVFGAPPHARAGELAIIISGAKDAYEKVAPLMENFTRRQTYVGKAGTASLFKVMQNSLGHVQMCAIAEVFWIIEKHGGDPKLFFEAVSGSGGLADSGLFAKVGMDFAEHEARFDSTLWVAAKDINTGNELAKAAEVRSPMLQSARDHYQHALDLGFGDKDICMVGEAIRQSYDGN